MAGCELDDTVIEPVAPGISVQAVMRPDLPQQFVLVEQTFDGALVPQRNIQPVPPGNLQTAITGAVVTVANLDLPADTCGISVRFDRSPVSTNVPNDLPGVYWSPAGCPTMRPGDRLQLTVDVPTLGTVTGVTRVPGLDDATLAIAGQVGNPDDSLALNRDRDVVTIVTSARHHRALQIVSYRTGTAPPGVPLALEDPSLSLMLFVDSTAATFPGAVRHVFARGSGADAFHGGRRYRVAVGVADTNYHDFVRTANDPITGRGFANHLRGGIGVFGSLVAASFVVNAVAEMNDPREGAYDYSGTLDGVSVTGTLTLYLAPGAGSTEVSGIVAGTWVSWAFGAAGRVTLVRDVTGQTIDGGFDGASLYLTIPAFQSSQSGPGSLVDIFLSGTHTPTSQFTLSAIQRVVSGIVPVGAVSLTRR